MTRTYKTLSSYTLLVVIALSSNVNAQEVQTPSAHSHHHHQHDKDPSAVAPSQSGQAAFGAVQEVVAMLEADTATNWSKVNVDALREHLRDMNELLMNAEAQITVVNNDVRILVTGKGAALSAAQRMVPAHAAMMNGHRDWRSSAARTENGVLWTITTSTPAERQRIKALGLFGLLTLGAHHGPHHFAIARGEQPHLRD